MANRLSTLTAWHIGPLRAVSRPLRRFAVWSNLVTAAVLTVLLGAVGCPRPQAIQQSPLTREGVPAVRVRITSAPAIRLSTTGGYRILADGQVVANSMDPLPVGQLTRSGRQWTIHQAAYQADRLAVEGMGWSFVRIGSTSYRGRVTFLPDNAGAILVVNRLDVETYLAGVLSRELLPSWSLPAYKAQAVAARTYALYEKATFGGGRPYDLRDDQSSQVYGGFSAETDRAWQAVRETHGVVLATGPEGKEKIFRAHYSACCGGLTNSVYVLYGPRVSTGPLAGGVVCTDCRNCSRHTWAPVTVRKDVIHRALGRCYRQAAELESVQAIEVVEEVWGRPVWINVVGPGGKKVRIRADDLRLALLRDPAGRARKLYSMNCRIRDRGDSIIFDFGRGFGHGVGLCQWGAEAKARAGQTAEDILMTYYPGAKLYKAYQ